MLGSTQACFFLRPRHPPFSHQITASEAPPAFPNIQARGRCSDELRESQKRIVLMVRGEARAADVPRCGCPDAAVPARRRIPPEAELPATTAAAHQPLTGLTQGRFLLHSLPRPLGIPPPRALFFVIPAGIKDGCSRQAPRSPLPSGTVCPHHLSAREPARPWEKYVFRACGVLICKAHYSKETLKWPSVKQSLSPCLPLGPSSPRQV